MKTFASTGLLSAKVLSMLAAAAVSSTLAAGSCAASQGSSGRYVARTEYLDLMEAAVSAYSDDHVARYLAKVERDGVEEHGFPRLTANIGVLVANGRLRSRREIFRRMMDISCREAAKGLMKREGNEFSVKELAIALAAVERAGLYGRQVTDAWRMDLGKVEARRCYRALPPIGAKRANNWCVFGCASEQARIAKGMGGDTAHVQKYVEDQMRWFDSNGMYRDPNQPAVYDMVTRLQFMAILHFGYDGPSRTRLEEILDIAAEPTLDMLSAAGEIPYGGRSNQFLHNHTFNAAVCEWYAARFHAKGDEAKAVRFRLAARAAVDSMRGWLAVRPMRHIKNLYPIGDTGRGSGIGCETYAYFDKYMVTMGSWAMLGWLFADESLRQPTGQELALDAKRPPKAFATTPDFHFVFLRAGDYSAQFDYNADSHYDCDGLGRIHRRGAPAAIFMSVPCATKPRYRLEHPNYGPLAMMPVGVAELVPAGHGHDADSAWAFWKAGGMEWRCRLSADGFTSTLTGPGNVALSLPAFAFDGENKTEIVPGGRTLAIRYRGWTCRYSTNGEIVDVGKEFCNRNGRYRAFEARGEKSLSVSVTIDAAANASEDTMRDFFTL